ncbi:MAG TPA: histidine kinase [Candidatus Limnocylindrales bacterium]|jgi:signal transduction histidine kinase|nr:histidine kinase [Candidatus Limnocylindrales bacterium]
MTPDARIATGGLRAALGEHPLVVDALVAVGLTLLSLVTIAGGAGDFGSIEPLSLVLILLQTLPLIARRIAPVPVFAITFGALLWQGLFAGEQFNSSLGALVALFTVAERESQRVSIAAAVVGAAGITALIVTRVGLPAGLSGLVQSLLTVLVVWLVGTWAQERRRYIGTVEERAARAEREREQRAALAVSEERERIARELHDVVSHHVSVIVIQAGAALRALDRRPDDARTALEAIDGSARAAMTEMRRMLGILGPAPAARADPREPATADDALAPMPGLARLGELLEQVRATGQRVELAVEGEPVALDPGLDLTAYRIVQEALTNTLKHAPDGRVAVTLRYEPAMLTLEVVDDGGRGRGGGNTDGLAHGEDPGHGVIGMIERAALFGGTLEAGRHGRGFRVAARLPIEAPVEAVP